MQRHWRPAPLHRRGRHLEPLRNGAGALGLGTVGATYRRQRLPVLWRSRPLLFAHSRLMRA
jgi:hypothetical protein